MSSFSFIWNLFEYVYVYKLKLEKEGKQCDWRGGTEECPHDI